MQTVVPRNAALTFLFIFPNNVSLQVQACSMCVLFHVLGYCVGAACCVRQESKGAIVGMRSRC